MPKNIFYINGQFIPEARARVSVFDLGFLRSYGVFTFLRTYNGKPFYLKHHLNRLLESARIIGLKNQLNYKFLEKLLFETLSKNKHLKEASIRMVLTGGQSKDGISPNGANLYIMVTPIQTLPEKLYKNGAKLITWPACRILSNAKNLVYVEGIRGLKEAKRQGALEILYITKNGEILECATSNFFAVAGDKIMTPLPDNILAGVTRKITMELAKKIGLEVIEKKLSIKNLPLFKETFITATNKEIVPITKINNAKVNNGKVGKITKKLMAEFKKLTEDY